MKTNAYIPRQIETTIAALQTAFPCIALLGARQTGKTTLARKLFSDKPYVSLEDPDEGEFASNDPHGFLDRFPDGAVLDEVQRAPSLFSYLQKRVDLDGRMGLFVLTGSQNFHIFEAITQSLAGRTAIVHLAPFSMKELAAASLLPEDTDAILFRGGYPPLYGRNAPPSAWLSNYVRTYIERDVRFMVNVRDLSSFQLFLRLCAGRAGQLLNLSSLGAECGISHNTAKAWISVLEASSVLFLLRPYFRNFNKRLVQTPKLYFYDTGLVCWLLGITEQEHLSFHPQRGAIFENAVVAEVMKECFNSGEDPHAFFWRDKSGFEIDLVLEKGQRLDAAEIKSGKTISGDFFRSLGKWKDIAGESAGRTYLVYAGNEEYAREGHTVLPWKKASLLGNRSA
jgi:predicted AAA+ superfamily ATPase